PLLDHEIEGAVYLGSQDTNPFEPPLVLYLIVNDPKDGIFVKLAGSVTPDPMTGQLTSTFKDTPQVPFEDLNLHFFAGGRASVTTARPDGDEAISALNVTLPKGVAGVLANVTPCPEPQAELGTCGEASLIGHATTVSGLGPEPFTLRGGNVYLTVGYQGAPFGLAIVFANIEAGPFHI